MERRKGGSRRVTSASRRRTDRRKSLCLREEFNKIIKANMPLLHLNLFLEGVRAGIRVVVQELSRIAAVRAE
jgi:hypothetical protein